MYQVLVLLKLIQQTVQSVGFPNDRTKQGNVGEDLINKSSIGAPAILTVRIFLGVLRYFDNINGARYDICTHR